MLEGLVLFGNAVVGYLNPTSLALAFGATLLGVVAGCMPGLSATLVITLLTTLTLKMQPSQAILVLVCAYNGAIYGGSRTAILLNIPGTAANAAACIDGYALAQQGTGRTRDGHRHHRLGGRHAVRPGLPCRCSRRCSAKSRSASAPSNSSGSRCSAS